MMDDLISRQAVKDWLKRWIGYVDEDTIARMQYRVIDIPSAQSEIAKEISKDTADVMESVVRLARAQAEVLESEEGKRDNE